MPCGGIAPVTRHQIHFWLTAALMLAAFLVGGGPSIPERAVLVQLIACGLLAVAMISMFEGELPRSATPALIFLGILCIVPLLQLIPLPSSIWHALPGRELPVSISQMIGQGDIARPLSLEPEGTRLSGLTLIVPIAMFMAVLRLDSRDRRRLMALTVIFALASIVLGTLQVAGGSALYFYDRTHFGYPVGFFANRNHEADLLLIAVPFAAAVALGINSSDRRKRIRERTRNIWLGGIALFLLVGIIATQSRTGLAILPVMMAGTLFVMTRDFRDPRLWTGIGGLVAIALVGGALLIYTPIGQHAMQRFNDLAVDQRGEFWQGTWVAVRQYWPVGSGLGSFVPVYQTVENLDSVTMDFVNHAHDDYLEILLETGIVGAILLGVYLLLLLSRLLVRFPNHVTPQRRAALVGIAILLLHSLTDYPLRTLSLLTLFAFLNALLFVPPERPGIRRTRSVPASPQPAFAMETTG
jgi:O-antigen ligase